MTDCKFTGPDFSKYTIDELFFADADNRIHGIGCRLITGSENCNFSNTCLNFKTHEVGSTIITKHID